MPSIDDAGQFFACAAIQWQEGVPRVEAAAEALPCALAEPAQVVRRQPEPRTTYKHSVVRVVSV